MRLLDAQAIEDLAVGATILGTGGGGDPYIGKLMALDAVEECGPVKLLDPSELADDDLVLPTAMMGAPTVIIEKIPRGDEVFEALHALEARLGRKARATMSIEAGGINSTIPLAVGARLDLPVVDCDGMGRAFPELQMVSSHLYGVDATPMTMSDEKGNFILLETISNLWTERLARAATVVMGGSAVISLYPLTGRQVKDTTIHHSLSLAETIGRTLREARAAKRDPIREILQLVHGYEIFQGKIVDVRRRTEAGFAKGEARFEGLDSYRGQELLIRFQNENLVAIRNGDVLVTVPDLITTLELETGLPITTEMLRYGYRAVVIGIPCDPKWRSAHALDVVGPRYFGYDVDYMPIEQRMGAHPK